MKKAFGLIALLAASAAVTVPAMAADRDAHNNNYRDARTTFVADRNHGNNYRGRDTDRRVEVRRDVDHDRDAARFGTRYDVRYDAVHCR